MSALFPSSAVPTHAYLHFSPLAESTTSVTSFSSSLARLSLSVGLDLAAPSVRSVHGACRLRPRTKQRHKLSHTNHVSKFRKRELQVQMSTHNGPIRNSTNKGTKNPMAVGDSFRRSPFLSTSNCRASRKLVLSMWERTGIAGILAICSTSSA